MHSSVASMIHLFVRSSIRLASRSLAQSLLVGGHAAPQRSATSQIPAVSPLSLGERAAATSAQGSACLGMAAGQHKIHETSSPVHPSFSVSLSSTSQPASLLAASDSNATRTAPVASLEAEA
ncbi:hypothetical protein BD289DRAFT_438150 [Coniella lustricola]|uniref:Uncharacterized protein n=1 Tax=Coniella lustricola TaxID=2025994 RepID=A0A2T3A3C9_9PEZI|nr:hypothetical protein BD289DRAFT_438150 [Coniella lustricola]